jgi:hypothetical protein
MELQLTIFFALTFLVLAGNAAVLWYIRRHFAAACRHLDANREHYRRLGETIRGSVRAAEHTSTRLAEASRELRVSVGQLRETMDRTDNWARYGLAKLDFNAERAAGRLRDQTRRLGTRLGEGVYRKAAAVQGVRAAIGLVARWRLGRQPAGRHAAPPVDPVDTALVLVQAITALGELFRPRKGAPEGNQSGEERSWSPR